MDEHAPGRLCARVRSAAMAVALAAALPLVSYSNAQYPEFDKKRFSACVESKVRRLQGLPAGRLTPANVPMREAKGTAAVERRLEIRAREGHELSHIRIAPPTLNLRPETNASSGGRITAATIDLATANIPPTLQVTLSAVESRIVGDKDHQSVVKACNDDQGNR